MIKEDELNLWKEIWRQKKARKRRPYFRGVAHYLGMPEKRAYYIFNKWNERGLTDCGVSPFAGWLNDGIKEEDLE